MSAKDRLHDTVVRALAKDGWTIVDEQVTVTVGERNLWIDIQAQKEVETSTILVEVKGFENMRSPIDYFADAVGKYLLYKTALEFLNNRSPLYMAVSEEGYNGILSEVIGQQVTQKLGIKLLAFVPEIEEIVQWTV